MVLSPATVDGPAAGILEFGGVAIAADGTGGAVYTKAVDGIPHVFACRFSGGRWGSPVRVDQEGQFAGSQPRIAADLHGRLLVVWVSPVATVHSKLQYALFSASMGAGANGFAPALMVDPNVGAGTEVDPALAGVGAGKAIVAYRVVTNDFSDPTNLPTAPQLRPGDVLADVRVARFAGERWSRLGPVNRNSAASMRPPTPADAPQVGIGASGNAVVAWQEPDQTGAARIWLRRIFGTTVGPPVQATPSSWEGQPVAGDADAFSLTVTDFDQARLAARVEGGGALAGPRVFLSTLEPNYAEAGAKLEGPQLADMAGSSAPAGPLGPPAVAASGEGGGKGLMRLAFAAGGAIDRVGADETGKLASLPSFASPKPSPGSEVAVAVGPEGNGVTAYRAINSQGSPAVAVRQEFPGGEAQLGILTGSASGPVSELDGVSSGSGDALIGFRQGEPGAYEIVVDRISAPPVKFDVTAPKGWVRPRRATVHWQAAGSAVGGVTYSVLLEGQVVGAGLTRRSFRPRPALLGTGRRHLQVIATDALGGQVRSEAAKLRVDAQPPTARVRVRGLLAIVRAHDNGSGLRSVKCRFSGAGAGKRSSCRRRYDRPGRYAVVVVERDRAGNRIARRLKVRAR